MIELGVIYEEHKVSRSRMNIVNKKININLVKKILVSNLAPAAAISCAFSKDQYLLLDTLMSFFSHFLTLLEET